MIRLQVESLEPRLAPSAVGDLDPSFGTGGLVLPKDPTGATDAAGKPLPFSVAPRAMRLMSDGRVVVAGQINGGQVTTDIFVARFTADGAFDKTFGSNGLVVINRGTRDNFADVFVRSDGSVVTVGTVADQQPSGLLGVMGLSVDSLTPAGKADPNFGAGGNARFTAAQLGLRLINYATMRSSVNSVGRVLVPLSGYAPLQGGNVVPAGINVARVTGGGKLDTSWGTAGVARVVPAGPGNPDDIYVPTAVASLPDGHTAVVGYYSKGTDPYANGGFAARLNSVGSPDKSFAGGVAIVPTQAALYVGVDKGGRIFTTFADGNGAVGNSAKYKTTVMAFSKDGVLDSSFGVGGVTQIDAYGDGVTAQGGSTVPNDLTIDSAGRVVIAGYAGGYDKGGTNAVQPFVARLRPDGSRDTSFGDNGVMTYRINGVTEQAYAVAVAPNNDILTANLSLTNPGQFSLARIIGEPGVRLTGVAWNTNRSAGERGFDITYDVSGQLDSQVTLSYYWSADGKTKAGTRSLGLRLLAGKELSAGQHTFNEPAHFNVSDRPTDATSILVFLDITNGENKSLPIGRAADLLPGNVSALLINPYQIAAAFIPGAKQRGVPATVSEAEVALGIDHFNWLNEIISVPIYWSIDVANGMSETLYRHPLPVPDPFVLPSPTTDPKDYQYLLTYGRVPGSKLPTTKGIIAYDSAVSPLIPRPDEYPYYFSETLPASDIWSIKNQNHTALNRIGFVDQPLFSLAQYPFFESGGTSVRFRTALVGVRLDGTPVSWSELGYNTQFSWLTNTVGSKDLPVEGGIFNIAFLNAADLPPGVQPVAGGIFDVRLGDGSPVPGFPTDAPTLPPLPPDFPINPPTVPSPPGAASPQDFAVAAAGGTVRLLAPDRTERFSVAPFGAGFTDEVRSAVADFNGDGVADLVAGTGPGRATRVVVLDGKTQAELFAFDPFEASFTGGVFVAAGDVNGDGTPDLVVTPDEGGGPRVRIFSGKDFAQLADFLGIEDPNFRGGARPTLGDVNGDGRADLVIAAGFGGGPRVAAFDGTKLGPDGGPKLFADFFAFELALRNGVYVAAGDLDGDGFAEVVAGGGPGGAPRVAAFDGKTLTLSGMPAPRADFFAGDVNARGGVRVAVKNLDGDGMVDLVTGAGPGSAGRVAAYYGKSLSDVGFEFDAAPGNLDGVFVG